ncbi:hypothetical protein GQ42DRAFT_162356 [Ramicandelaber brevisporus]|nr:hypothetical protein GQ42DRAFT_162356 [Ramicandelaber brevisporus]
MKTTFALAAAAALIAAVTPAVQAECANQAVYDLCMSNGKSADSMCVHDNWGCRCDAAKAIRLCYLQCTDDPIVGSEAKNWDGSVTTYCDLAARQAAAEKSSAPSQTTPAPTNKSDDKSQPTSASKPSDGNSKSSSGAVAGAVPAVGAVAAFAALAAAF